MMVLTIQYVFNVYHYQISAMLLQSVYQFRVQRHTVLYDIEALFIWIISVII